MKLTIELGREADGCGIAEVAELNVLLYGDSRQDAVRRVQSAARETIPDRIAHGELPMSIPPVRLLPQSPRLRLPISADRQLVASYAMLFHGNQSAVFEVHTIAFQHWPEDSDCGLRPAAFAPKSDDGGCLQTANGDGCVKVGVEGDHRDMPALIAQLSERRCRVGGNPLVEKELDGSQIGPAHAADVS